MARRPNILLLMADQLNPAFLPMYGNPIVKAPHLQALAERERIARDYPEIPHVHALLADSQNNLGILLRDAGRTDEALQAYA